MTDTVVGERERIQILLAEYSSLRSEIISQISTSYTVLGIWAASIAWLLQQPIGTRFWIGLSLVTLGALYSARLVTYDVMTAAKRVCELEATLNERADEKLLVWESERGGLNPSWWRGVFFLNKHR
jgi:hypothetical protein